MAFKRRSSSFLNSASRASLSSCFLASSLASCRRSCCLSFLPVLAQFQQLLLHGRRGGGGSSATPARRLRPGPGSGPAAPAATRGLLQCFNNKGHGIGTVGMWAGERPLTTVATAIAIAMAVPLVPPSAALALASAPSAKHRQRRKAGEEKHQRQMCHAGSQLLGGTFLKPGNCRGPIAVRSPQAKQIHKQLCRNGPYGENLSERWRRE